MSLISWPSLTFKVRKKSGSYLLGTRTLFALGLLLALLVFAPSTFAQAPIFGPKTFTRIPGRPEVFQESFTLSSLAGTLTLVVQNGDPNGKQRIKSGEISLNGFKIVGNTDLSSKAGRFEKIINASVLRTTNLLNVSLKGGQGVGSDQPPFITVSIIRHIDDIDGPVITINQPKEGDVFANSPIEVSGTVSDISGVASLKVNGVDTPVVNDAFNTQVTLNPGPNQITVMATDSAGNSSQKSVEVILATPKLLTVNPNSGQAGVNLQVEIKGEFTHFVQGTTQANFGAGIAVGGSTEGAFGPVTVVNPTTATAQITINAAAAVGPRTVSVQTGSEQLQLVNAFNITAAPPPPPIIISVTPNTAQAGQNLSVIVTAQNTHFSQGSTQASFGAGIAVGGAAEGGFGPVTVNSPTSITAQITLNPAAAPGPRTVSIKTGTEEVSLANGFTVTAASEGPTISITSPASGTFVFVKRPSIEVSYNAAAGIDFATLTFTANDQPLTTECQLNNAGGRCTATSDLPEGAVTLVAAIKDLTGNTGTGTVQFTVDSVPVQITIATPAAGLITKDENVVVTGTFGTGVNSVKVNDVTATLANNTFSATVPLKAGVNMLVAVGTTANGKTGTNSVTVTLDAVAPIVRIDSPRDGFTSLDNDIAITGVVNDIVSGGVDAQVKVNGINATVSNGAFMVMSVPLVRGPNTIEAVATDGVGNVGKHSITVNFEVAVGARLTLGSGDGQKAVVKQSLSQPLVAVVKDGLGNPVAGRVVRFEVTRNSGTLRVNSGDAPVRVVQVPTDGSGRAAVLFTLGDTAGEGNNRVTATALGVAGEVSFCATALPAPANKILANMGDNQRGVTGQPLANRFEALVVDLDGNPLQGVDVTFTVVKGNGRLDGQESQVRVTGNDGIARAVLALGPDPGISNNVVNATFEGLTGLPATFTATGLAPGDPANTRFSGVVLDNGHNPIPGALVTIDGTNLQATTDQNGQFLLTNVPVGQIHLHVDPSNSPRPETFPELAFVTVTVAGQNNILGQPILIPALDMENSKIVGGNQDVTLTMRGVPGLAMTIFANSVRCPDGSSTCRVTISQVHLDKVPMAPPNGTLFMPPAWTIQPHGVHFTIPARMTIPNNGLAPGRIIDMFQFDHDLNMFVNIGKGTVSQDGLTITTDPGFGITAAGWGGGGPPPPPRTCVNGCDDKNSCTDDKCDNGTCVHTTKTPQGSACTAPVTVTTSFPEHLDLGHLNPGTENFGVTLPHYSELKVQTSVCLEGNTYKVRVVSATSPVDIDTGNLLGRDNSDTTAITADNFCQRGAGKKGIIDDLDDQDYVDFISADCNLAHEREHKKEWEVNWNARFPQLKTALESLSVGASATICTPQQAQSALQSMINNKVNSTITAAQGQWNSEGEGVNGEAAENACNQTKVKNICADAKSKGFPACALCPP